MTYSYPIEWYCALSHFNRLDDLTAETLINLEVDLKLYNTLMGREVNFRVSDLSSIYQYHSPEVYIRRTVDPGDDTVLSKIKDERPVLNLAVHNLLPFSRMLFETLGERLCYVHMVRHPIYMLRQQELNFDRYIGTGLSAKDFSVYSKCADSILPYYAIGWSEGYLNSDALTKSIKFICNYYEQIRTLPFVHSLITIPFEAFVQSPYEFIDNVSSALDITDKGSALFSELKSQNVPRARFSDGQDLEIYRRCGWRDLRVSSFSEEKQLLLEGVEKLLSFQTWNELMNTMSWYEQAYMCNINDD